MTFFFFSFCISFQLQLDRFIPNRSAIDFDYAHYMVTEGRKGKENPSFSSPSREAYQKLLAETFNMNQTRILAFKNKPPAPVELIPKEFFSAVSHDKPVKARRHIPQVGCSLSISVRYFHNVKMSEFLSKNYQLGNLLMCLDFIYDRPLKEHWMLLTLLMITT